jgi:hypothetical protein
MKNIYRRHWYNIGLFIGISVLVLTVIQWRTFGVLQLILLLNFVTLLFHQFEEYGWPGGEPAIMNKVLQPSEIPDRYPLNQNSAMITNVIAAYPFYLLPVLFPNIIWLALGPVLFGLMQIVVHGIVTNVKLKTIYNPGLLAVLVGHVPLGGYYLYYIHINNLATVWDWVFGVVYLLGFVAIVMKWLTYQWLAKKDSPYVFADVEMKRFNVDAKLARITAK